MNEHAAAVKMHTCSEKPMIPKEVEAERTIPPLDAIMAEVKAVTDMIHYSVSEIHVYLLGSTMCPASMNASASCFREDMQYHASELGNILHELEEIKKALGATYNESSLER